MLYCYSSTVHMPKGKTKIIATLILSTHDTSYCPHVQVSVHRNRVDGTIQSTVGHQVYVPTGWNASLQSIVLPIHGYRMIYGRNRVD